VVGGDALSTHVCVRERTRLAAALGIANSHVSSLSRVVSPHENLLLIINTNMSSKKYGTRSEVWDDLAEKTRGGLMKTNLMISKTGKIVSRKKSELAKKSYAEYGFKKREERRKGSGENQPQPEVEKPRRKKRRRKKTELEE
jgi:hypothetical protein